MYYKKSIVARERENKRKIFAKMNNELFPFLLKVNTIVLSDKCSNFKEKASKSNLIPTANILKIQNGNKFISNPESFEKGPQV